MELIIEKAAAKVLQRLQAKVAASMMERIGAIAADPFANHANVKPLAGQKGAYRLRQGDWRIVYFLDRRTQRMHILDIDTRRGIYK